jgi:hypothetical protein
MHRNDLVPSDAAAVTPSDTGNVNFCGICAGTGGDIKVRTAKGTDLTFEDWPGGAIIPLAITRIWLNGTTATGIVGFIA